jgi:hypothetical protein
MAIRLRLGDEVFDIPTVGATNWGEQITLYLEKNSEILSSIQGPQDILLTPADLAAGGANSPIPGLSFDTSNIQQILVEGTIIRSFTGGETKIDSFRCEGIYDFNDFYIDTTYTGTDAQIKLDVNSSGQFLYDDVASTEDVGNTESILIRFKAKAIIDE